MARYEGDWIKPDPEDEERGRNREQVDHSKYWNRALHNVLEKVAEGDEGLYTVTRQVKVKHSSPGWVDGYRVDLG